MTQKPIYEKLDSEIVEERHLEFAKQFVEDTSNYNTIFDLFAPFLSVEDTIINFLSTIDKQKKLKIIEKSIKECMGKDKDYFYDYLLSKRNG